MIVGNYSVYAVYRLFPGFYCQSTRATGIEDLCFVSISFMRVTVCNLVLTVSATVKQTRQASCWSLQKLCGTTFVLWDILSGQNVNTFAECFMESIEFLRCTICTLGFSESATVQM